MEDVPLEAEPSTEQPQLKRRLESKLGWVESQSQELDHALDEIQKKSAQLTRTV